MPTQNVTTFIPFTYQGTTVTLKTYSRQEVMTRSPKVNGKLKLRANPFSRQITGLSSFAPTGPFWDGLPFGGKTPSSLLAGRGLDRAIEVALVSSYARLRGKVYKGSASLGVTAGSYKQSADMIRNRYNQLTLRADYWDGVFRRLPRHLRTDQAARIRQERALAGFHLEVIFGWMPLFSDILAATTTVIQLRTPPEWVSARSQIDLPFLFREGGQFSTQAQYTGRCVGWIRRSGAVEVSNPNLWLAERAGLLNGVSVAWDLVPWSFLVNMIGNIGQLVNSVTDFVGLSWSNDSLTQNLEYNAGVVALRNGSTHGSCRVSGSEKFTTLGGIAVPPLVLKLPNASWETATMAVSLFTQKFLKLPSPSR